MTSDTEMAGYGSWFGNLWSVAFWAGLCSYPLFWYAWIRVAVDIDVLVAVWPCTTESVERGVISLA